MMTAGGAPLALIRPPLARTRFPTLLARSPRAARAYRMTRDGALADEAYRAFKVALRPFLGRDPALAPWVVARAVRLRSVLLARLGLPTTRHNVDRLVTCAAAGLPLPAFLRDVDRPLPHAVLAEEALFLAALAAHAAARGVHTAHGRRSDAEAFLGLPHDDRSSPIVGAWLDGALPWTDLALWTRQVAVVA